HHYYYQNDRQIDCYAVVRYWAGKEATPDDLIEAMIEADQDYNIEEFYLPHDQPGIAKTARATLSASKVRKAKIQVFAGINMVSRFLNSGRLKLLKRAGHELAWKELSGYRWKEDREGNFLDEPFKQDDHYPDAIRYLIASRHLRDDLIKNEGEPEKNAPVPKQFSLYDL
ncbi:MAG: terminase large subunit, partial [Synechococcaceae cyanobacterium]|nr:terminase large subunit [Synechococcaceae cyanobacterium]